MALTQAALLQRLDAAGIAYAVHEHDAVLTIEAQVQALSGQPGTPLINLFLKVRPPHFPQFGAPDTC